jgi:hypothetical protein
VSKRLATDKHSSLFVGSFIDKVKKFEHGRLALYYTNYFYTVTDEEAK